MLYVLEHPDCARHRARTLPIIPLSLHRPCSSRAPSHQLRVWTSRTSTSVDTTRYEQTRLDCKVCVDQGRIALRSQTVRTQTLATVVLSYLPSTTVDFRSRNDQHTIILRDTSRDHAKPSTPQLRPSGIEGVKRAGVGIRKTSSTSHIPARTVQLWTMRRPR